MIVLAKFARSAALALAFGLSAAATLPASVAEAQNMQSIATVGAWKINYFDNGTTKVCDAARKTGDSWLHIDRALGVPPLLVTYYHGDAPQLNAGRRLPLVVYFETPSGEERLPTSGVTARTSLYSGIRFVATSRADALLRQATAMRVEYNGFTSPSISLADTAGVYPAIERCAQRF